MSAVVVGSMRNEGAFLLEWVCWYRMLGFSRIVVATNDCTDRSPDLLDKLAEAGWVEHLRCNVKAGQSGITATKLAAVAELRSIRRAAHVLVCDVDEFLVIHAGAGKLADLMAAPGRPFLGMAINWRVFGSGGVAEYVDKPVHQQFKVAIAAKLYLNRFVKTLYGHPRWFGRMGEHGPARLNLDKAEHECGVKWGQGGLVWITPSGQPVKGWQPEGDYLRVVAADEASHAVAQMNHYMLRSAESFWHKRGTLSPVAGRDRYTKGYWSRADRRDAFDDTALRYDAEFARVHQEAMALPGVARLHYLCCADHVRQIVQKANGADVEDPRHAAFLAKAAQAG